MMNHNPSASLNQTDSRFVCKLFGNRNHDYIEIANDDRSFIIHKTKINEIERRGLITNWEFELDHIYDETITPGEVYENEINCFDFLGCFSEGIKRTIVFVGSSEDTLRKDPLMTIIRNSINDFLLPEKGSPGAEMVVSMSWCEIAQRKVNDLLMRKDKLVNYKLSYNEDEICIEGLKQVELTSIEVFDSIIEQFYPKDTTVSSSKSKKPSIYRYNTSESSERSQNEQSSQLLSVKYYNTKANSCISKVNFLLYRAYEFTKPSSSVSKPTSSLPSPPYSLYTKENYAFFNAINCKLSSRSSSILKFIEDTYYSGKSLFIINVPIEIEYMVLIHDLLNNVRMRKLTCQNFVINAEVVRGDSSSPLCYTPSTDDKENEFILSNHSFETTFSTKATNSSTKKEPLINRLNIDRLKQITSKANIAALFNKIDLQREGN